LLIRSWLPGKSLSDWEATGLLFHRPSPMSTCSGLPGLHPAKFRVAIWRFSWHPVDRKLQQIRWAFNPWRHCTRLPGSIVNVQTERLSLMESTGQACQACDIHQFRRDPLFLALSWQSSQPEPPFQGFGCSTREKNPMGKFLDSTLARTKENTPHCRDHQANYPTQSTFLSRLGTYDIHGVQHVVARVWFPHLLLCFGPPRPGRSQDAALQ
jgi:hypothetical protein